MPPTTQTDSPTPLDVPALWCPFPQRLHPAWRTLDAAALAWAESHGLTPDTDRRQRAQAIHAGELGARSVEPDAPQPLAQLSADHLLWLFTFDDAYCDEGALGDDPGALALLVARLVRTAETGQAPPKATPHEHALLDLRNRIARSARPLQLVRWTDAMRSYLAYQTWEAAHRSRHTAPTLDAYLGARIANGSMPVCCALLDVTSGFTIPAGEFTSPAVRALTEMCCALVGYDNDLLSHWKETLRCGDGINLVDVLATETRRPPQDALHEAVALRDTVLHRYLTLARATSPDLSPEGRRYLGLLDQWIRGNLDWSLNSGRYLNPQDPARLPETILSRPEHGVATDPLPYPGVAWWWTA
ncbi:hypothetical protein ABT160_42655 [Streptomyces sp. NPDC001941]|uniref:terpene synthase family protein n=1 Tax=Streptomyces sp. NPDC001941 TaxID=3154659 RepID=UPI00331C5E04